MIAEMSLSTMIIGMLLGAIGVAYFIYGRKQSHLIALLAGVVMCVLPFAIADPLWLSLGGVAAAAAPFVIRV